jgi:hypothetical protein
MALPHSEAGRRGSSEPPTRWCAFDGDHTPSPKDNGQSTTWNPREVWAFATGTHATRGPYVPQHLTSSFFPSVMAEERLPGRDGEEVLPAHRVGRDEQSPQQARVPSLSTELVREVHPLPEPDDLPGDRVELAALHDGKIPGPHAPTEARDEVAAARDDQERALHGIVERDRHPLDALRQRGGVEHSAEQLRVAVELEREIHLAARQAIEA